MAGGTNSLLQFLNVGAFSGATGTVWLTGGQLTVTNNIIQVGESGVGQMTVSNGTWRAQDVFVGEAAGSQGTLTIAGGTNSLSGFLAVGSSGGATGAVWLTGGQLTVTNGTTVGNLGVGQMTVSNGTWLARLVLVGAGSQSQGTLTLAGGTNILIGSNAKLVVGDGNGSTGIVLVTGGQLVASELIQLGYLGVGSLAQSGGSVQTDEEVVGAGPDSQGSLTVAGGAHVVGASGLSVGNPPGSAGTVWLTGGQLLVTNANTTIGFEGVGRMTVSNGTWQARNVVIGTGAGGEGTLTVNGGSATLLEALLGNCALDAMGFLVVKGGDVFVTNTTHDAVLEVRNGWVLQIGGALMVDKLVMTNDCGLIFHGGGSLIVGSRLLGPNLDADDDGLPNGWEQAHGFDPLSSLGIDGPDGDPDHDGFTNLEEYEGGSDPTDPNSIPFRVILISAQGNDVLLTWLTAGGKTNVVQAANGTIGGNYATNGFANLSSQIFVAGDSLTTTNYLDVGGATNVPARYYRVRLVP